MILKSLKYSIVFILSIYFLNAVASFSQETINFYTPTTDIINTQLKLKTRSRHTIYNNDVKDHYFETINVGVGIFTNRSFYAFNGGYTKQLNSFLSLGFNFNIFEKLKKRNNTPPPSLELTALYTKSFLNNRLFLFTGAGPVFFLMTDIGSTYKIKLDYKVFKNVFLGGEMKFYLVRFKIYETPLLFINSTIIF